jgi:hypothetical protein
MYRLVSLALIFVIIIVSASCSKKEYTCECIRTYTEAGSTPESEILSYNGYVKRSEAEIWCEYYESNSTTTNNGITTSDVTICHLK